MSADSAGPQPGHNEPHWTAHARDRWQSGRVDIDSKPDGEWPNAVPVDYPDAQGSAEGRYHPEGDAVLIYKHDLVDGARRPVITTVIDLTDRTPWEQAYVRNQAAHARGGGR